MSNRNILKGVFTIFENESGENCEIEPNKLVAEKIRKNKEEKEERQRRKQQERIRNMTPEELEEYEQENNDLSGIFTDFDNDEFEQPVQENVSEEILEEAREEANRIVEEANAKADEITSQALEQAESMKEQAIKEGQKQGYDMGMALSQADLEDAKLEMQKEIEKNRQEFIDKEIEIEGEVLQIVCDVIEKVFKVQFSDKKELLMHLCVNALTNVESSKQILIKVNEKNNEFLQAKKEELIEKVGEGVQLDIIMDPLLDDDKCILETDGGIFDCSIDVEIDNFIKDLRTLSI